jgi:hypothetical protein
MNKALVVLALAGCSPSIYRAPVREPTYYSINSDGTKSDVYSRVNEWSSYGTRGLGAQSTIAAAYEQAQHKPPPTYAVEIFNATLPPGVTLDHGALKIVDGAPYQAIGRFEIGYWKESAPHEAAIEPDLHRLAQVTGGDTIVIDVQHFDHADDRVQFMVGVVLQKRTQASHSTSREHARAHLVYTGVAGCSNSDEFADEVSARLGYSPWQASGPELHAEIARANGAYVVRVSRLGATPRSLVGPSCKAAIDAAVTAVVVELDDLATTTATD